MCADNNTDSYFLLFPLEHPLSRLLITGSRAHQWTSYDSHALLIAVQEILEKTHELPVLVHGGATGADTKAARMGQQLLNLPTEVHRADWTKYGRAAGPIRNKGVSITSNTAFSPETK